MAMFYPSKQIVFISLFSIALVGGAIYYTQDKRTSTVSSAKVDVIATSKAPISNDEWKEQFIDTFVASTQSSPQASDQALEEDLNSTQIFGRQLLSNIIQMQNAGVEPDEVLLTDMAEDLSLQGFQSQRPPVRYKMSSINVTREYTDQDLYAYFVSLVDALKKYMPEKENGEPVIAMRALDEEDYTILKDIDPIIEHYESLLSVMTSIKVPQSVSYYHLDLTNGISMAKNSAEAFRSLDNDPLRGMTALSSTIESIDIIAASYQAIEDYVQLKSKNI